jgi:hypothetical protein
MPIEVLGCDIIVLQVITDVSVERISTFVKIEVRISYSWL